MINSTSLEVSIPTCVDFSKVPLSALNHRSYQLISGLLNKTKIFKSEEGYYRDWRGLFQVLKLEHFYKTELDRHANPAKRLLQLWQESTCGGNLKELQLALGKIDRWDILDDSSKFLYEDAEKFLSSQLSKDTITDVEQHETVGSDDDVITRDDTRHKKQFYDAFILFADADIEFATKIMERMEERKLKLCVKDRDLLAGINFEHDAIIKLISERCRRLVVVISKEFLMSPLNNFFVMYAQALQIEQKKRKILPCVYERMELPANLKFYFILDYKRSNKLYNFWDKLEDAIKARTDSSVIANKYQKKVEVDCVPHIEDVDSDETLRNIPDQTQAKTKSHERKKEKAVDLQQPFNKSLSSWDISEAFNRVLTNKYRTSSSSTSDLTNGKESSDFESKKPKWFSKLSISPSKPSLDEAGKRLESKKIKWYKTSKKLAQKTAT